MLIILEHFKQLKLSGKVCIPDVKIFSTAFIGTLYNVIMTWLQDASTNGLTDYAYALTIYNLQALKIDYSDNHVKEGIAEVLSKNF